MGKIMIQYVWSTVCKAEIRERLKLILLKEVCSIFRLLGCGFVCVTERQSPNSTQVFHSELIQGDIFGFGCKHSLTRDTMGLSERHLKHRVSLGYTTHKYM